MENALAENWRTAVSDLREALMRQKNIYGP